MNNLDAALDFSARVYRHNDITFDPSYFSWQFGRSGGVDRGAYNGALMAMKNGRVVGTCAIGSVTMLVAGSLVHGGWIQHWFTEAGNGPLGLMLLRRLTKPLAFFGGAGASSAGLASLRLAKPDLLLFELTRLFAVIDPVRTLELSFATTPQALDYLKTLRVPPPSPHVQVEPIARFGSSYDRLWEATRRDILVATDHDSRYMNWRYRDHPYFDYACRMCHGPAGAVVFVWRNEQMRKGHATVARLCEAIGKPAAIAESFPSVIAEIAKDRAAFIDFFGCNAGVNAGLLAGGMHIAATRDDFDLARLFQPLERSAMQRLHFYVSFTADCRPTVPIDYTRFYVTKTDSNQDRPNLV